jgi:hypothetical protein
MKSFINFKKGLNIFCLIIIFFLSNKLEAQNTAKLDSKNFSEVTYYLTEQKFSITDYNFNGFPCSLCSGGWVYWNSEKNNFIYSYKGQQFVGKLTNPYLEYFPERESVYITCNWTNSSRSNGFSSALIRFEIDFNSEFSANTYVRLQALNTELVTYVNLSKGYLSKTLQVINKILKLEKNQEINNYSNQSLIEKGSTKITQEH